MKKTLLKHIPGLILVVAATWLLLQLVAGAGLFFEHIAAAIRFPYALDYGEGPLLDQVMHLARFENIYKRDLSAPPYTISNYPPLFLLVQVPLAWLFGPALWYGRVINLISLVVAAVSIGLTIYTMTDDLIAGIVAGLTLLLFPFIIHWSAFNRIDALALGISCAGLYVVVRWGHTRRGLIWGAALLTASVYTRQSYALAAPMAAFVWLLRPSDGASVGRVGQSNLLALTESASSKGLYRDRASLPDSPAGRLRRAFELAAWVAGMGLGVFGLLNLITWGGFYFNIVTANVNPFYWGTVWEYVTEMWKNIPLLLVAGALFLSAGLLLVTVGLWRRKTLVPKSWWVVAPYLVGATASAITIGKSGSNVNYLFEFCAALGLAVGAWIAWPKKWPLFQAALMLALVPQVAGIARWTREGRFNWIMGKIAERDEIARMTELAREVDGPVLADEYMALLPLAGKPLYYQPFELKQLYLAGIWDESGFLRDIQEQKFPLLLIYDPQGWNSQRERWTPQQLFYISLYYEETDRLASTIVYQPKSFVLND